MFMSYISLLPFATLTTITAMIIQRKHLLMALLALETMILSLSLFIPIMLMKNNPPDAALLLSILTFGACEASIGLACLVSMMRTSGNDLLKTSNMPKC